MESEERMKTLLENTLLALRTTGSQQDDSLLSPVTFDSFNEEKREITVSVPSAFYRDQFLKRYSRQIQDKLETSGAGRPVISCRISPKTSLEQMSFPEFTQPIPNPAPKPKAKIQGNRPLNNKLSFSHFITGPSNQFAYTYSQSVAENPGKNFNPLFIYGGSGLGKTHLLNAIALMIHADRPHMRVTYQTAEDFTNRMISHIQRKQDAGFRDAYRKKCDVLLIDDIQFISGKERTTEEFFHIFNSLYESGKQIVLTSDIYPRDLTDIPERLRSRFAVGLIADIQPPELETRVAILNDKLAGENFHLSEEVVFFLASACTDHVRQLEGALMQLKAYSSLVGKPISVEIAKDVLRNTLSRQEHTITVEGILKAVSGMYSVKVSELKGPRRHKTLAYPRQQAMYLARKLTGLSYPEIGKKFGGKDHSTVIHAEKKIRGMIDSDTDLKKKLTALEELSKQKS